MTTLERAIKTERLQIQVQGILFGNPKYLTDCKATEYSYASQNLFIESLGRYDLDKKTAHIQCTNRDSSTSEKTWVYLVGSMDIHTYHHSRLYLSQYRALHAINLIKRHNDSLPTHEQTLLEGRTPAWLIDRYIRLVKLNDERCHDNNPTYHGRHVHRSEAYQLFGRHARWLRILVKKQKLLNNNAWSTFCVEAEGRNRMRKEGKTEEQIDEVYGPIPDPPDPEEEQEHFLTDDDKDDAGDMDVDYANDYPVRTFSELYWTRAEISYYSQNEDYEKEAYSPGANSPLFSDDEENLAVKKSRASLDPLVGAEVPQEILWRPTIPRSFVWFCPVKDCDYMINLHKLTDENLNEMQPDDKKWLRQKQWKLSDERFTELFDDMVERHYFTHLDSRHIKLVGYKTDEVRRGHKVKKEREVSRPGELKADDEVSFHLPLGFLMSHSGFEDEI